jgi:hypothetical protein
MNETMKVYIEMFNNVKTCSECKISFSYIPGNPKDKKIRECNKCGNYICGSCHHDHTKQSNAADEV